MEQAIKFIPLMLMTLALAIVSSFIKRRERMPWLIVTFILWLMSFLYAIGGFNF